MVDEPSPKRVSALRVPGSGGSYTYDGRPSLRHDPTARLMPRQRYEQLLLERMHASQRWENQSAQRLGMADLEQTEIVRTMLSRQARPRSKRWCGTSLSPFLAFRVMLPSLQIMHQAPQQLCSAGALHTGKRVKDGMRGSPRADYCPPPTPGPALLWCFAASLLAW